ncbi:hypothetical protein CC86DRAFT_450230 [Ophiobolus disseminans]|uniref:Uncharacterized protein n=1 Tax=Ophiobolus disseminans TaxID=1469910 RepID=A0A6A6ZDZ4_9PLEO|nr:hypothetical protein CC86DRAFT_450230 [Ophiobolus disseminans]
MPSSTKRTTTRVLATSAAVTDVAPTRNLYPSRRSDPSSRTNSDSCREGDQSTKSFSDTYSDPDTEADTDIEPGTSEDAGLLLEETSEPDLDSEAERKKHSRLKKESSIRSYWKRLSMCYMDLTHHKMDANILTDDLYAILHALWVDGTKPLYGFIRVQISLLLLLSAATATRPGAIVKSASAKGSNKALSFKNIEILKVRSIVDPRQSTVVANINLENIKNKDKDRKP